MYKLTFNKTVLAIFKSRKDCVTSLLGRQSEPEELALKAGWEITPASKTEIKEHVKNLRESLEIKWYNNFGSTWFEESQLEELKDV